MRFKGQLLLPGESGPGLKVNLDVAEHHLAVESDGGGLGAWPLEVVDVERLRGDLFGLTVAGEDLRFVAEDTIAFAYSAVPAIENVTGRSRNRAGVRSMIGRLWKGSDKPEQPAVTETLPVDDLRPPESQPVDQIQPVETLHVNRPLTVEDPAPAEEILDFGPPDSWAQQAVVIEEPVGEKSVQVPVHPAPEPPVVSDDAPPVEVPSETAQCPAVRSDGRHCESQILTESGYCYPHDPRRAFEDGYEAAQEARAQLKKDATARLNRIYARLEKAMRQVERGELDPETAMAMAQLARTMCAILEMDEPTVDGD